MIKSQHTFQKCQRRKKYLEEKYLGILILFTMVNDVHLGIMKTKENVKTKN